MNIKPLPGYCLIEPIKDDNVTASGLRLPDSSQDYPMKGKIIERGHMPFEYLNQMAELLKIENSVGKEMVTEFIDSVRKDKIVLFKKYSGQDVKHEGKEYKLVKFEDLLAVIE